MAARIDAVSDKRPTMGNSLLHMHVLIADDDPGTRLLWRAVERLGHRCTVAEDGEAPGAPTRPRPPRS